ncbi:MAG: AhpC/TSA family protein [Planctomycetota bacterium]
MRPDAPTDSPGWRRLVVGCGLALGLTIVAIDFWRYDLRYSLPTPRAPGLEQPAPGARIDLPPTVAAHAVPDRPLLLHFFNAQCPCSRFNLDHLQALVRDYRGRVTFVAVLQGDDAAAERPPALAGFDIAAVRDHDGGLARLCGVYSTPQAVLLTAGRVLFFRGNYNLSRFCTDATTAFAQQAIDALLAGRPLPGMPAAATTAYGCELPSSPAPEAR